MSAHDPMCPADEWTAPGSDPCQCDLIARTRADERKRTVERINRIGWISLSAILAAIQGESRGNDGS